MNREKGLDKLVQPFLIAVINGKELISKLLFVYMEGKTEVLQIWIKVSELCVDKA